MRSTWEDDFFASYSRYCRMSDGILERMRIQDNPDARCIALEAIAEYVAEECASKRIAEMGNYK